MARFDRTSLNGFEKDLAKALDDKVQNEQKITTFEKEMNDISTKTPLLFNELESKLRKLTNTQYTLVKPSTIYIYFAI